MSTIQNLFEQAQLAEAAYADFSDPNKTNLQALKDEGMSTIQATDFLNHWTKVDQYTAPSAFLGVGGTGFSATLFKNTQTGAYTFAIRGSTPAQGAVDFIVDAELIAADGIAIVQVVDMYNYWQSLTHTGSYQAAKLETSWAETAALKLIPLGPLFDAAAALLEQDGAIIEHTLNGIVVSRIVKGDSTTLLAGTALASGSGKLSGSAALNVTGHSLGGHLSMAFTRLFPTVASKSLGVNGLGFKIGNGNVNGLTANAAIYADMAQPQRRVA